MSVSRFVCVAARRSESAVCSQGMTDACAPRGTGAAILLWAEQAGLCAEQTGLWPEQPGLWPEQPGLWPEQPGRDTQQASTDVCRRQICSRQTSARIRLAAPHSGGAPQTDLEEHPRSPTKGRLMPDDTPQGGDPQIFQRLLDERIVFLGSEVTDSVANEICAKLLLLNAVAPEKDIYLYINSPGGSITAGFAIYDAMNFVQADVATVALGFAASMGQFLLSSGAKGKRYALPNASIVMHQPHGGFGGSAADIQTQAKQILFFKQRMAELTSEQTGKPLEQIAEDADRDRWFTAAESLDYGFVDHIVDDAVSLRR
jgi:ATP-dependent Clp protease protease subunit